MTRVTRGCLAGTLAVVLAGPAFAQESKSASLAKELAAALEAGKLDSIAAKDPARADAFVAALYYPGSLLVVSGRYSSPPTLVDRIDKKDYREVYVDLQSASTAGTKVFVQDAGADGLRIKTFDSIDLATRSVSFDGDWKKQKFASEAEYTKAVADADEQYAKMLTALLAQLKKTS